MKPVLATAESPVEMCPFCRSAKVKTTSEKVDPSSYWRCEACGEVWNVGRLRGSVSRYTAAPTWKGGLS